MRRLDRTVTAVTMLAWLGLQVFHCGATDTGLRGQKDDIVKEFDGDSGSTVADVTNVGPATGDTEPAPVEPANENEQEYTVTVAPAVRQGRVEPFRLDSPLTIPLSFTTTPSKVRGAVFDALYQTLAVPAIRAEVMRLRAAGVKPGPEMFGIVKASVKKLFWEKLRLEDLDNQAEPFVPSPDAGTRLMLSGVPVHKPKCWSVAWGKFFIAKLDGSVAEENGVEGLFSFGFHGCTAINFRDLTTGYDVLFHRTFLNHDSILDEIKTVKEQGIISTQAEVFIGRGPGREHKQTAELLAGIRALGFTKIDTDNLSEGLVENMTQGLGALGETDSIFVPINDGGRGKIVWGRSPQVAAKFQPTKDGLVAPSSVDEERFGANLQYIVDE